VPPASAKRCGSRRATSSKCRRGEGEAAAAAAKGKPAPAPEELPVEDAKPLEDRYRDDGSVTVEDRKKFSLRSGGTAAGLPAVGVVPGERMSADEMINEIGSGKKIAIIAVAVAVVGIIVAVIVMSMHKKSVPAASAEVTGARGHRAASAARGARACGAPLPPPPRRRPGRAGRRSQAPAEPARKHVTRTAAKRKAKKHR